MINHATLLQIKTDIQTSLVYQVSWVPCYEGFWIFSMILFFGWIINLRSVCYTWKGAGYLQDLFLQILLVNVAFDHPTQKGTRCSWVFAWITWLTLIHSKKDFISLHKVILEDQAGVLPVHSFFELQNLLHVTNLTKSGGGDNHVQKQQGFDPAVHRLSWLGFFRH
jgi:hypothetical protein